MTRRASIAVDLGAESCRVSLLRWVQGEPELQLVHRFANGPVRAGDGSLRWPLDGIVHGVDEGVRRAAELAPEGVASVGVDGWAVDYVRLDQAGRVLGAPFCYRDERNQRAAAELHSCISAERLRELTGVEQQALNTLYQLFADKLAGKPQVRWLNLPEYLLFRWGAEPFAEHTNATHTQLIGMGTSSWNHEIFHASGLEINCAPSVRLPGTKLGKLSGPLAELPQLSNTELIAPACHDTASAIAGIGESGEDWAYISCGTWSLIGTVVPTPLNQPGVRADNFTNLGAVGGMTLFHKGVCGMWPLKQCMDAWAEAGHPWELTALLRAAEKEEDPIGLLDVDDPSLSGLGNMPGRINAQRASRGLACLSEDSLQAPKLVSLLLHSLAARYALIFERVQFHSGKDLRRIVMVGGGAQNAMLRRLTAERTGVPVQLGHSESATVGNLAVQLAALEEILSTGNRQLAQRARSWARRLGRTTASSAT